jgi:hypothetical protein
MTFKSLKTIDFESKLPTSASIIYSRLRVEYKKKKEKKTSPDSGRNTLADL